MARGAAGENGAGRRRRRVAARGATAKAGGSAACAVWANASDGKAAAGNVGAGRRRFLKANVDPRARGPRAEAGRARWFLRRRFLKANVGEKRYASAREPLRKPLRKRVQREAARPSNFVGPKQRGAGAACARAKSRRRDPDLRSVDRARSGDALAAALSRCCCRRPGYRCCFCGSTACWLKALLPTPAWPSSSIDIVAFKQSAAKHLSRTFCALRLGPVHRSRDGGRGGCTGAWGTWQRPLGGGLRGGRLG